MHKPRRPDHSLPVFLEDLYNRGLDKKVLLASSASSAARAHQQDGGREHWPHLGNWSWRRRLKMG